MSTPNNLPGNNNRRAKEISKIAIGERVAVTGGKQMDGFI
jgi:hypothetical protein